MPTKSIPARNGSRDTDPPTERAGKRRKRSLQEDNINMGGFLIPNKVSASAAIAKVTTPQARASDPPDEPKRTQKHVESDTEMGEEGPATDRDRKITEATNTVRFIEYAETMFKQELKCPKCSGKGTVVKKWEHEI